MNGKRLKMLLPLTMAFGLFFASTTCEAADINGDTATPVQFLGMKQAAGVFIEKYPQGRVHSVSLDPKKGQYTYKVEGYDKKNGVALYIDIFSGDILKTKDATGLGKNSVAAKTFHPLDIIDEHQASAIAAQAVGPDAIVKAWSVEAEKGVVTYDVTVHQADQSIAVTLNAKDGMVLAIGEPEPIVKKDKK